MIGHTIGDRIVETWSYWNHTGDYPWPGAFRSAIAVDVEELAHLQGAYVAWQSHLASQKALRLEK